MPYLIICQTPLKAYIYWAFVCPVDKYTKIKVILGPLLTSFYKLYPFVDLNLSG